MARQAIQDAVTFQVAQPQEQKYHLMIRTVGAIRNDGHGVDLVDTVNADVQYWLDSGYTLKEVNYLGPERELGSTSSTLGHTFAYHFVKNVA